MADGADSGAGTGATGTGTAGVGRTALLHRALRLAEVDRVEAAYQLVAEALREDPEDSDALQVLAHCHRLESRWAEMLTALDTAASRTPDNPRIHGNRSVALRELGRIPEAVAAAELGRRLAPDNAEYELIRAEALLCQRGTRAVLAALAATRRARELDPEGVWARVTEARVQRRMAEFGRARTAYLEALRLAPDNPQALYGLATIDAERGRWVRGTPFLGGVLRAVPTAPGASRTAAVGARQTLWLLTDLGCVLLLLANLVVVAIAELLPSGPLAAALGLTVTVTAGAGVAVLLRWQLARLPAAVRATLRADRYRPGVVAAPLRLAALVVGASLISLGRYLPEAVEEVGSILFTVMLVTLLLRWWSRPVREFLWLVRRCWFRLHRRSSSPG